ncbi:MAG: alpha/beta fold hydrolase, partial [Candidatus Sericytochromatia bacterium]
IFLHGGPGSNSYSFEYSTAQKLSNEGFYVITFDQRGSGRSKTFKNSKYTFEEASNDLNDIYKKYNLKKASLIGHSFGGTVGIKFSENNIEKVDKLFLVSSPLSYQDMFKTIISNCKERYKAYKPDYLKYIDMLEKTDPKSLDYSTNSFYNAMTCGLYNPKNTSEEAKEIYKNLFTSKDSFYLSDSSFEPVEGFYKNEHYTTLDLKEYLSKLSKKLKVYGVYGVDDGLFDTKQLNDIKLIVGENNFKLLENASHGVFVDQQKEFINIVKSN